MRLLQNGREIDQWESELHMALANLRLLLSRAIDFDSPHSRFLNFKRRTTVEEPILSNGTTLIKKFYLLIMHVFFSHVG